MTKIIKDPTKLPLQHFGRRTCDVEIRDINREKRTIKIRAATKNIIRDECILPQAFQLDRYRKNPVIMWAHDYSLPPIGKALWVKPDKDGLLKLVEFAKTSFADDIFYLYADGFLNAWSIGWRSLEWVESDSEAYEDILQNYDIQGHPQRIITRADLYETSAVPLPADPDALTTKLKTGEIKSRTLVTSLEKLLCQSEFAGRNLGIDDKKQEERINLQKQERKNEEKTGRVYLTEDKQNTDNNQLVLHELNLAVPQLTESIRAIVPKIDIIKEAINLMPVITKKSPGLPPVGMSADDIKSVIRHVVRGEISRMQGRIKK